MCAFAGLDHFIRITCRKEDEEIWTIEEATYLDGLLQRNSLADSQIDKTFLISVRPDSAFRSRR